MISLRTCANFTTLVAAALLMGACSEVPTGPQRPNGIQPGSANADGKVGDTGNADKHGTIDVRVFLDKNKQATLEVHTGTFDDALGVARPNGVFENLHYKVYDASKHQVLEQNIEFHDTQVSQYVGRISLCSEDDENDDESASRCASQFGLGWTVSVQAKLKGVVGDGDKADEVRGDGIIEYLPDVDMTQQRLFAVAPAGNQYSPSVVPPGTATTFSVPIPNNKVIAGQPNRAAAVVTCVVTVDGKPQLAVPNGVFNPLTNPNAFGYVGNPIQTIPAGGTGACQFTLTLPAGPHTISVTAVVLSPGDYDLTNNTTPTFAVTAAVVGPPDVAVGVLQQNLGGGPTALGVNPIYPGASVELDQWVMLVSGTPPGTVTCTITLTNTATNVALPPLTATATLGTPGASAACKLPVVFPAAGTYTAVSTVVTPAGIIDPVPQNNVATNTITVAPPPPSAAVTIAALAFTDPAEKITAQRFSPSLNTLADTVHSGDLATYTAAINIASLQNATSVPSITCSATVDGVPVASSQWLVQTISNATASPTPTCSFKQAITEASITPKPHTIVWSIVTGSFVNLAPTSGTTLTGTINAVQRVDVSVGPLQVVPATGAATALTTTGVKQGSTVTLRFTATNLSTVGATVVDCGPIVAANVAPTTFAVPPSDTVPTVLTPTQTGATRLSLAASGTGVCSYTVSAPASLGLIAIPLAAGVTTVTGNPLDPDPSNNWSTGTMTVLSNGQFTTLPSSTNASALDAYQSWFPTAGNSSALDSLTQQGLDIKDLALLLVPTQDVLGTFALSGTVTSGATDQLMFGTGTTGTPASPISLPRAAGLDQQCVPFPITSGQSLPFANAVEAQLRYSAIICSQVAPSNPGYQQIVISYSQSLASKILGPSFPLMFADHVTVKIRLNFTITGAALSDAVSATVTVPIGSTGCAASSNDSGAPLMCSSNFGNFQITTP